MTDLLAPLRSIVGDGQVLTDADTMTPYLRDWRGMYRAEALAVVRPAGTAEVAGIVRHCAAAGLAVVPQGGNTGLVGGCVPEAAGRAVIVNLSRMNRIRDLDPIDYTMTVEAGCTLAELQQAAAEADRLFPLSLAAEGSCRIGGNLSTNAGGTMTVRYGNTRDLVLGVEAVLPDGRIWDGLTRLRKNNTGYDLKHLFIGGEGTLGLVTAAVLKLYPRPRQVETAILAVPDVAAALALLARLRTDLGDTVTAFELIPRLAIDFARKHVAGTIEPLAERHDHYILAEFATPAARFALREALEAALEDALTDGLVLDATLAASGEQRRQMWALREAIVDAQRYEGGSIKHDVSVPVSRLAGFLDDASAAVSALIPGIRIVAFGHLGDGNIHFNLNQPEGADTAAYLARWAEVNRVVHDIAVGLGGSYSAEHGIGRLKRGELVHYGQPVALEMMRAVKRAIDPQGLMNPGIML
ncbi:MAG TPA: FAD-binding oxidoreductase [Alphaproteobacteria bacterium]|nr:FAD-binding oxidoreductase [Alphaproteobacteria bacterium]